MSKTARTLVIPVLCLLAFYGFGCNPFQKAQDKINQQIGEKVAEGIIGKATGGKVDIQNGGNQVTYKDNKTGATSAFGEDVKLPDDFPKTVPIYPGSKINGVTTSKENGQSAWVMMTTNDEVKQVVDWYVGQTKGGGWKEDSSLSFNNAETRTYSKGNEKMALTVTLSNDQSKGKTSLIVTWNLEEKAAPSDAGSSTSE